MKIAFYLDNTAFANVDCSSVKDGNPGIGGTEYMFLLISSSLSERNNGFDITFFTTSNSHFPKNLTINYCKNLEECIKIVEEERFDYLVIKHDVETNINSHILDSDRKLSTRIIIWAHVFMCYWELDYYADNHNIFKVIHVGKETSELYIDHRIYSKSSYIFNAINLNGIRDTVNLHPVGKRKNIVVYIGHLAPFKGFHLLAKVWKQIILKVPDAELYVIGSGKLYDRNAHLGKYGIAQKEYEDLIMPYLTDSNGNILHSVHFMGVMGKEKYQILKMAKVGVPNPSGITETFCISAVEMQMMGVQVATYKAPGYLDTVRYGILGKYRFQLANNIIRLLRNPDSRYDKSMDYFESNFSVYSVVQKWEKMFREEDFAYNKITNLGFRFKWLKYFLRNAKKILPGLNYRLFIVERILLYIERKLYGPVTYLDSNNSM